ncbi:MAG: septum formation protein Maf [Lachnospiraceae bacterium]|nr:septum formation protein Maf [Lachnospiraceae bacterium]MBQ6993877.1 septum formation protein Maf [Lachnospiraceae bacterium]
MVRVILASGSPRRKELLEQIGVSFEISVADGEEVITRKLPWEIVEELSLQKATEVAGRYETKLEVAEQTVVIGADTIVAYGEEIMGKPRNEEMAKEMLRKLQDGSHQVYTGVTLIIMTAEDRQVVTFHEKTDVEMYSMSETQIDTYVATKEPMDKAGGYAIQGKCAAYIKGICGDYNNVVGLPVARLMQELFKLGIVL